MSDAVYSIETVRAKVLAHLRKHKRATAEQMAAALHMPVWAVQSGLESAEVGGLARRDGHEAWALGVGSVA